MTLSLRAATLYWKMRCHGFAVIWLLSALAIIATAACAVLWGMHITAKETPVPAHAKPIAAAPVVVMAPAPLLFGAGTVPDGGSAVFSVDGIRLQGVVTDRRGVSVALVSIDGATPARFAVKSALRDGVTLREIHTRHIIVERGGNTAKVTLVERQAGLSATAAVPSGPPPPTR
jgi:general secretion pathway protein C